MGTGSPGIVSASLEVNSLLISGLVLKLGLVLLASSAVQESTKQQTVKKATIE